MYVYIRWAKNVKEFTISVTHNVQSTGSYSYIPKPVLKRLGNPWRIKFTMRDEYITVDRPNE